MQSAQRVWWDKDGQRPGPHSRLVRCLGEAVSHHTMLQWIDEDRRGAAHFGRAEKLRRGLVSNTRLGPANEAAPCIAGRECGLWALCARCNGGGQPVSARECPDVRQTWAAFVRDERQQATGHANQPAGGRRPTRRWLGCTRRVSCCAASPLQYRERLWALLFRTEMMESSSRR